MDNAELAIGIDLGTTNSLIAVWKDGAAQLIPNKFGEYLTPSIISMDENNHILVGKPAVSRRTSHPDKTAALFKRAMGSNTNWRLGSDTFNAPELSSLVLRSLKEDAEEFLQRPIKELANEGMTMMVVTHEMGFARKVANRVIFMDEGKIIEDSPKDAFFDNPKSDRAKDFLAKILH